MSRIWLTIFRYSLAAVVFSLSKVSPEQWAHIGQIVVDWLISIEDRLPAGNPLVVVLNSYKAAPSRLGEGHRQ
jgi:hypothetical protein